MRRSTRSLGCCILSWCSVHSLPTMYMHTVLSTMESDALGVSTMVSSLDGMLGDVVARRCSSAGS